MDKNTHHEHHASSLSQCFLAPLLAHLALLGRGTIVAIRVTTSYRYPGNLLVNSTTSGSCVYPSCTLGWEAKISVLLSSPTCSTWVSLAVPLVAAIMFSGLTDRRFTGSNSAVCFFLSRWVEGPIVEASSCCGRGARGAIEIRDREGSDGLNDPVRDLRARRGASCFLKLDIYEKKQRTVSSKKRLQENTKTTGRNIHTHLKRSINELHRDSG